MISAGTMSSSGSSETIDWNSVTTQIDGVRAASFFNRRGLCKNKRVLPCRRVNWDMARESGIWDHLKDWLKQLLWLADCMIALMAKNKCVPPRPQPTIREDEEEPMEEEPEEDEDEYDDTAHS
ncbi:hypothetical protein L2E82_36429 [Cichorium intybus]|uniref:Uncharacterized protein n=1 Tax=Cichorium intybus TaxID=13427 RepID=A0ACB9BRJ2_CICIN|nr:hypothetical protein L2E82_36429 [Cichorium intybus]